MVFSKYEVVANIGFRFFSTYQDVSILNSFIYVDYCRSLPHSLQGIRFSPSWTAVASASEDLLTSCLLPFVDRCFFFFSWSLPSPPSASILALSLKPTFMKTMAKRKSVCQLSSTSGVQLK